MLKNDKRNKKIVEEYKKGNSVKQLAEKYYITESAIRAILRLEMGNEYFAEKEKQKKNGTNSHLKPRRATKHSAGYDFTAPCDILIKAHGKTLVDTEVTIKIKEDKVMLLFVRSSLGIKHMISLANGTGVIDSDYHETIKCMLVNNSDEDYTIKKGERYIQGVVVKYYLMDDDEVVTTERKSGIGSTGK